MRMIFIVYAIFTLSQISCSSFQRKNEQANKEPESGQEKSKLELLEDRLYLVESKLVHLQEKLNEDALANSASKATSLPSKDGVDPSLVNARGKIFHPESAATQASIQYKDAKILYDAGKYNEAQLGFSKFLTQFNTHPLASSAQLHLGLCAFSLKEWALSKSELEKSLTLFPYSAHISDALKYLVQIETLMNNPNQAQIYEQTLLSLFPQSPAAHFILNKEKATPSAPETKTKTDGKS